MVDKPFRMKMKWIKQGGYSMGSSCSATIFGNGDVSASDASSVLSCLYDGTT